MTKIGEICHNIDPQNLKLYRHPFILRYVDFCETADTTYLFTEKASPLSLVIKQQSYLQICLGLQNVIQVKPSWKRPTLHINTTQIMNTHKK
jgi:hypothetical protein